MHVSRSRPVIQIAGLLVYWFACFTDYWFAGLPVLQQTSFLVSGCDESAHDEEVIVPKREHPIECSLFGFVRGMTILHRMDYQRCCHLLTILYSLRPEG